MDDVKQLRIGQPVHMLFDDGQCYTGLLTRWNVTDQAGDVIAFREPDEASFTAMFPHGKGLNHDPDCNAVPQGAASFHLPDECVWGR